MPSLRSPQVRIGSPAPGCSTLITSAPYSASAVPTIGPAASVAASITRRPCSGPCPSGTGAYFGARETEVVAQRRPCVAITEDTATLQLGHDGARHVLVRAGHVRRRDHEPVARVAVEPLLHLIGDLRRRADEAWSLQQRGAVPGKIGERDRVANVLLEVLNEPADARHRLDQLVGDGGIECDPREVVV